MIKNINLIYQLAGGQEFLLEILLKAVRLQEFSRIFPAKRRNIPVKITPVFLHYIPNNVGREQLVVYHMSPLWPQLYFQISVISRCTTSCKHRQKSRTGKRKRSCTKDCTVPQENSFKPVFFNSCIKICSLRIIISQPAFKLGT